MFPAQAPENNQEQEVGYHDITHAVDVSDSCPVQVLDVEGMSTQQVDLFYVFLVFAAG